MSLIPTLHILSLTTKSQYNPIIKAYVESSDGYLSDIHLDMP